MVPSETRQPPYMKKQLCVHLKSHCSHMAGPRGCIHVLIFYLMATLCDPWVGLCLGQLELGLIATAGEDKDAEMAHSRISLLNHRSQHGIPRHPWVAGQQGLRKSNEDDMPQQLQQDMAPAPCRGVAQLPGVHSRVPILGRFPRPGCKYQPWPQDPSGSPRSSSRCAKTSWCEAL